MLATVLLALVPQGAVASSQPDATAVGLAVLEDGGNAVDAAIAVHFALAVTLPYAGNLGGGGFLLAREADGRDWLLDFRETAPAAAHPELYLLEDGSFDPSASLVGWKAAGVPGAVPGMWAAYERAGSLPWARLVEPARRLAAEGFRLGGHEARRIAAARDHLARDPLAARIFLDAAGRPLPAGTLVRQPELAALLGRIAAEGEAPLREGPVVERLVAASDAGGGILTAADFRDYRPELREVVRLEWRGRTVLAAPPPSSGGIFLAHVLAGLEGAPLGLWGRDDARTVQLVGEATARAFALRNRWLGDPASMDLAPEDLLDPALLRARRRGLSPQVHTPPSRLGTLPAPVVEPERTTHFSVMDAAGGAVSCTTTLNGLFGAKVMAPDGFFLNNEMDDFAARPGEPNMYGLVQSAANAVLPGRRPLSSMCPVIVLDADGRVDAVVGSPGGPTILTTVLQVLLNRYVHGMSPRAAVAAPRFHRQDRPPHVQFEPARLGSGLRSRLGVIGQPLRVRERMGDVNAIFRLRGGGVEAVADPRSGGAAGVLEAELDQSGVVAGE